MLALCLTTLAHVLLTALTHVDLTALTHVDLTALAHVGLATLAHVGLATLTVHSTGFTVCHFCLTYTLYGDFYTHYAFINSSKTAASRPCCATSSSGGVK